MELIQVGPNTYYLKNVTNIGIYKINESEVYLIDTGNDKDAGKKILKVLAENNFQVKGIINTHSHADHIGGNKIIQERTNSPIYNSEIEEAFTANPILESAFLYGGAPLIVFQNKFLKASPSCVSKIASNLPPGLEYFSLKGHSYNMLGIKTSDNVYFLGDVLFSAETIEKYHIFYIYDVGEFLKTLDYLETLKGNLFIPSHAEASSDISSLITINRAKVMEIITKICDICTTPQTFEEINKALFDTYNLTMNANQYILVGSTIRSYLSYLVNNKEITFEFIENKMYWTTI